MAFSTKVFVIEYPEVDLQCLFTPIDDVDYKDVGTGDLVAIYEANQEHGLYRLSRDKKNLLWLQSNLADVNFIVFVNPERIEAINHHRADVLAAFLPWKLESVRAPSITFATSIPL